MGASLRRVSICTLLLVACSADSRSSTDIGDITTSGFDHAAVAAAVDTTDPSSPLSPFSPPISRTTTPSLRCDGTPLPACEGPFTGATCDLPCVGPPDDPTRGCGVDVHCHSDGSVYGLAMRNAVLFSGAPDDPLEEIEADFEAWIVAHAADLALEPELAPTNIELYAIEGSRSTAGALTIVRFTQTFDGLPVLAPDGTVTLVYGPQGPVAMTGAILDDRVPYAHRDHQASQARAEVSMLHHASAQLGVPLADLELQHVTRVAMPMARTIAWAGFVGEAGGARRARVIVDADPEMTGPLLPLLSLRRLGAADLADREPIQVLTVDPAGEPQTLAYGVASTMTTGAPLIGSVDDASGEIQLADERVVVLDMHGRRYSELVNEATRVLSPTGEFLEESGADLSAQVAYHLLQGWYDFIDAHMTDPVTGAKRWESANDLYSNGAAPSDTPLGTYVPRVLASVNASEKDCPVQGTACAGVLGHEPMSAEVMAFPELYHVPMGATNPEGLGHITLPGEGINLVTLAHEMGHIVDLFTGGGITNDFAPDCGDACSLECIEGTTDEAPPLTESIAQMFALLFLRQSFEDVVFDYCPIVDLVAVNGDKPWTPGACIPPGEDISLLQRVETCSKPAAYCDKPDEPGTELECCFDDEDLSNCTIPLSDDCPVGAVSDSGGIGTGTARAEPTGLCATTPGYQTNSIYQAFWQMLNGQRCQAAAPFSCASVEWVPGMDPMDATTDAFLYALRVNALTYDQLFEEMARYVSCNYGADAYEAFNAVACAHGIRDCAAQPPMICTICGNGVREGSETCDGTDWLRPRCEDSPEYSGGTLTCDQATCTLDESQCTMPGLDTTAGTESPTESTSGDPSTWTTTSAETDSSIPAGRDGDDGCRCRAHASRARWLSLLVMLTMAALRRRRRVT